MSRVSIVIPSFNCRAFLTDCLRSVRAQEFTEWEAIVVDDCSTDGGPKEVIAALGDSRIRLLQHERNRGLAASRNTGFEAARSPLVLPLDGDDVLAPSFLPKLVTLLDGDAALDCAFTDFELFGAATGLRAMGVEPMGTLASWQWLPGAGVLMRRALWERAGRYCEAGTLRLGNEDWDFWLSAAERGGFRAVHVPKPLYRYRQHAQNMSHGLMEADFVTRRFLLSRHSAFIAEYGRPRGFLADGYWRAAEMARERRRAVRAGIYGLRAVLLGGDWLRARNHVRKIFTSFLSPLPVTAARPSSPA